MYCLVFFNPVINICLAHVENFSDTSSADSGIVSFYGLLANFFGNLSCFRVKGVVFFAFIAKAPLCSRTIFPCVHLIFRSSADRTMSVCIFFCFSHSYIISYHAPFVHTFAARSKILSPTNLKHPRPPNIPRSGIHRFGAAEHRLPQAALASPKANIAKKSTERLTFLLGDP